MTGESDTLEEATMTDNTLSAMVEFRGGPEDGRILITPPGHVFEVRLRRDEGTIHYYEETGSVTAGGHREAAYRGAVYSD